MAKLWLVKDKKGRIFGPYKDQEICFYIDEGEFKGEEFFSSYPAGEWKPLSAHPLFYEKILAQLNKPKAVKRDESSSSSKKESDTEPESLREESEPLEPTRIVDPRKPSSPKKEKIKIKLSKEFKEEVLAEEGVSEIIEAKEYPEEKFFKIFRSPKMMVLFFIALLSAGLFIFITQKKSNDRVERVHLLPIRLLDTSLKKTELKATFQAGLSAYYKGGVSNYLKAQRQYVKILSRFPDQKEMFLHLCLVYLELWPFSHQDEKDKNSLNIALNLVSKKDKGGVYSGLCKSVQALINKKPEQALMTVNSSLNIIKSQLSSVFFYYVKAKALKDLGQRARANSYLQSVFSLKPEWTAPYMLSARMAYKNRQYALSAKLYQKVLSIFPGHPSAGLRMGVLEYKYFKKTQESEKRLKSVLARLKTLAEPTALATAYFVLANIYFKKGNKEEALKYVNKAYALDPEQPDILMLKSKLGKKGRFEKFKAWGLIYKGDRLVSQGDCPTAKKYFEKAYSVGQKKSALAALKIAQCYWQSRASGQAIRWLRRSINADRKMLTAYFLLADYLSALYDFESAKDILKAVKKQHPNNYDLFKAYALLFFRQKQYQSAVTYAERSLEFYTSDAELYVLLSRSYRALGKAHKSFSYAQKAIQEDPSNVSVQIAYALSLDLAYGHHRAKEYFDKLIRFFPLVMEYSQALAEYYFNKGMYEEARLQLESLVEQDPKFKPAHIYLGRVYSRLSYTTGRPREKYEKALRHFLDASLLDISDPEPLFYSAQTHIQHEQYLVAESEFEKIARLNPNYPLIYYYIGLVNFYQQGEENLEKALKFAKIQMAKNPNNFLPYKLAGDVYKLKSKGAFSHPQEKRNVYELCAKEYQKALQYMRNDIELSIGLIECYKGAGNVDMAIQSALEMTKKEGLSGYPELYREIGGLFELNEKYEKARSFYSSYFSLKPGAKDRKLIETRINKLISEKESLSKGKD